MTHLTRRPDSSRSLAELSRDTADIPLARQYASPSLAVKEVHLSNNAQLKVRSQQGVLSPHPSLQDTRYCWPPKEWLGPLLAHLPPPPPLMAWGEAPGRGPRGRPINPRRKFAKPPKRPWDVTPVREITCNINQSEARIQVSGSFTVMTHRDTGILMLMLAWCH